MSHPVSNHDLPIGEGEDHGIAREDACDALRMRPVLGGGPGFSAGEGVVREDDDRLVSPHAFRVGSRDHQHVLIGWFLDR